MNKIYTGYFAKLKSIPDSIVPISICGKAPAWWKGIQYKTLAPHYSFFSEWKKTGNNDYYIEHYNNDVLAALNVPMVLRELDTLSGGKDIILVCYEKPSDFCHRHLVAKWLSFYLPSEVVEFQYE